jgi:hypothetical protein
MSVPLNRICPDVGVSSRVIIRPVVDLPQPDSPTRPRLPPASSVKLTPSTAWTTFFVRDRPAASLIGKCIFRSRISSSGVPAPPDAATTLSTLRP